MDAGPAAPPEPGPAAPPPAAAGPAIAVVLAGLVAYAGSLSVPLQFDDVPNIVDDPAVHAVGLSPRELAPAVRGFPFGRWLARGSFAVNHAVHGLRPAGYHAVNVALHLAAALLVLSLARRLLDGVARGAGAGGALALPGAAARLRAATVAALLFAVHPVQTQAVTYVVQRMTVMGTVLALAALRLWLAARDRRGRPAILLAAAAAAATWLAVSCKENFVVVPAVALVLEAVLAPGLGARLRARWRAVAIGAFAAGVALAAMAAAYWPVVQAEHARLGIPVTGRLLSQGRILLHYLSLLVLPLPSRLHVDYAWPASTGLLAPPTTLPALAAVAALAVVAVASVRRAPLVALGVGWFLAALVVEQSVLPIDLVFEHRLYFAAVGLFVLAGAALVALAGRLAPARAGPAAWALAAALSVLLAAGTVTRNARWRDPALLFADDAGLRPGSARGLLTVAATLRARGRLDEAERVLRRAIELQPDDPGAYVNLGNVELDRGRPAEAEAWYRAALARDPRQVEAWYDLGILLGRLGRLPEAMDAYRRAFAVDPGHTSSRVNLALLQHEAGDRAGALATLDEAIRLDPGAASALANRAILRAAGGRVAEALEDARRAARIAPERLVPWIVLAEVERAAGNLVQARAAAERAVAVDPRSPQARELLRVLSGGP